MKRSDIFAAIIIGEVSAWLILLVFKNIRLELPFWWIIPVILPILSLIGMWLASILGKRLFIIYQASKFLLVGILNTLIDLGILNFLILITGMASGLAFSFFKGASFLVAVVNSYFWNKFWTFKKKETTKDPKEFAQFFVVALIGLGINVLIASFIVNVIGPQFGLSEKIWANLGAIAATFFGMTWNFLGYKFIVFK
ncbi:GtrA family protein [Patescibacteria group bacterium]|nr:GtrA family protein [Patescibacteria group bacterium]